MDDLILYEYLLYDHKVPSRPVDGLYTTKEYIEINRLKIGNDWQEKLKRLRGFKRLVEGSMFKKNEKKLII